jgi:hypothetical protein
MRLMQTMMGNTEMSKPKKSKKRKLNFDKSEDSSDEGLKFS